MIINFEGVFQMPFLITFGFLELFSFTFFILFFDWYMVFEGERATFIPGAKSIPGSRVL